MGLCPCMMLVGVMSVAMKWPPMALYWWLISMIEELGFSSTP